MGSLAGRRRSLASTSASPLSLCVPRQFRQLEVETIFLLLGWWFRYRENCWGTGGVVDIIWDALDTSTDCLENL